MMYKPSRLVNSFHIAGFQYYDGALVFGELQVGDALDLVAVPDNPHDPDAVAIYRKDVMLGYVPRAFNAFIAQLLRFGHSDVLECRVLQKDPSVYPDDQVFVGVYMKDACHSGDDVPEF